MWTGGGKWADRVDPKSIIAAASLDFGPGGGRSGLTLASEASSGISGGGGDRGTALGSGAFGKVGTYRYHGAVVAVKELRAGVDEETIGAVDHCGGLVLVPYAPPVVCSNSCLGCNRLCTSSSS